MTDDQLIWFAADSWPMLSDAIAAAVEVNIDIDMGPDFDVIITPRGHSGSMINGSISG